MLSGARATLANSYFGQFHFVQSSNYNCNYNPKGLGTRRVEAPNCGGPNLEKVVHPKGVAPEGEWSQNFALFFHSPATIFFLSSLS